MSGQGGAGGARGGEAGRAAPGAGTPGNDATTRRHRPNRVECAQQPCNSPAACARCRSVQYRFGGRRSTRMIALGVVNACGAMLPATDRGTITAVITEPTIRPPAIGFTLVTVSAACPAGRDTLARIGAVVPVAVPTTRSAWVPVSVETAV